MAEEITEQEILDEVPQEEVPQDERPEHIPEKFWKDGAVDYNEMAKSYTQLESYAGGKEETIKVLMQNIDEKTCISFVNKYDDLIEDFLKMTINEKIIINII